MLALGIPGALAGLWMVATNLTSGAGALLVAFIFLALFGMIPLAVFAQGRRFLAIASETEVICFPADRKKKQVQKAIETLEENCDDDDIRWEV